MQFRLQVFGVHGKHTHTYITIYIYTYIHIYIHTYIQTVSRAVFWCRRWAISADMGLGQIQIRWLNIYTYLPSYLYFSQSHICTDSSSCTPENCTRNCLYVCIYAYMYIYIVIIFVLPYVYIYTFIHTNSFDYSFLGYKMSFLCRYGIGTNTNTMTKYMNIYMHIYIHTNSFACSFLGYKMSYQCRYGIGKNTNTVTICIHIYIHTYKQFRLQFSGVQDELSVQIWDWDKYRYDDYIGEALIPTVPLVHVSIHTATRTATDTATRTTRAATHTMTMLTVMQHTATHCNIHCNTHCNTLQHTATHCNTLQHTPTHSNTLQHTPTHYNTLQHTATHFNTLQHTATHVCISVRFISPPTLSLLHACGMRTSDLHASAQGWVRYIYTMHTSDLTTCMHHAHLRSDIWQRHGYQVDWVCEDDWLSLIYTLTYTPCAPQILTLCGDMSTICIHHVHLRSDDVYASCAPQI